MRLFKSPSCRRETELNDLRKNGMTRHNRYLATLCDYFGSFLCGSTFPGPSQRSSCPNLQSGVSLFLRLNARRLSSPLGPSRHSPFVLPPLPLSVSPLPYKILPFPLQLQLFLRLLPPLPPSPVPRLPSFPVVRERGRSLAPASVDGSVDQVQVLGRRLLRKGGRERRPQRRDT